MWTRPTQDIYVALTSLESGRVGLNLYRYPFMWLLSGRVFVFRLWGVDVYLHASLIVVSALVLLFGAPFGATPLDRFIFGEWLARSLRRSRVWRS